MAINLTLQQLSTLNNTSILAQSNANFSTIQTALASCLSLNGQLPNAMTSNLDMNSNQIINLPPPGTPNSPARLVDVVSNPSLLLTVPPTGTSGATVPFCNSSGIVWSGFTTTFQQTVSFGQNGFAAGTLVLAGSTSGSSQISVNNLGQLFLNSPNASIGFANNGGNAANLVFFNNVGGSVQIGAAPLNTQNGILWFMSSGSFTPNGTVTQSLGSNGPTGSNAAPVTWLKILDNGGSPRFIPCF